MSERFFVEVPIRGMSATLTGQEATHLRKVLRARVGDAIRLFDGHGHEFAARVSYLDRHAIGCDILEVLTVDSELPRRLELGVALPRGDRQRVLVEKLTELGVTRLTPLLSERSVAQPDEQTVDRLRRGVIEASKQCGRNRLMEIGDPVPMREWLAVADASWRLIAHPGPVQGGVVSPLDFANQVVDRDVRLAIGPEGGFTDDEVRAAQDCGWARISLGPRILRVETAATALAALATAGAKKP